MPELYCCQKVPLPPTRIVPSVADGYELIPAKRHAREGIGGAGELLRPRAAVHRSVDSSIVAHHDDRGAASV